MAYFAERTISADSAGSRVRAMVRGLSERDVKVRFVYGAGDPGMDEFAVFFSAGGRRMRKWRNVKTIHRDMLDHACFSYSAREEMMVSFVQFVQGEPPQAARGGLGWARLRAVAAEFYGPCQPPHRDARRADMPRRSNRDEPKECKELQEIEGRGAMRSFAYKP